MSRAAVRHRRAACDPRRSAPEGFEPSLPPPEGGALSPELRGLGTSEPYPCGVRVRKLVRSGATSRRYPWSVTPEQLSTAIVGALTTLSDEGALTLPDGVPTTVTVERPRAEGARRLRHQRRDAAGQEGRHQPAGAGERRRGAAERRRRHRRRSTSPGPGFLNITVEAGAQGLVAAQIVAAGAAYGTQRDAWPGEQINVEFISANPTGPLHLGHTRWAVVGDAHRPGPRGGRREVDPRVLHQRPRQPDGPLRRLDRGRARWASRCRRTATTAPTSPTSPSRSSPPSPSSLELEGEARTEAFREAGYAAQLRRAAGPARQVPDRLRRLVLRARAARGRRGQPAREAARTRATSTTPTARCGCAPPTSVTTRTGCCIRTNGELTYFASDTAYYVDKRERGFDRCIYLLGADHHGYVGRLRAMAACAGDDPDRNIEVLIGQLVKIMRGGEEVRLSKRAGDVVTLDELVDEIGVDALRYSLARYPSDSPLTLDVEQITRASPATTPSTTCSTPTPASARMMRNAADLGLVPSDGDDFDPALLSPREGGRAAAGAGRLPAGRRGGRAAARAAPGRPLPRGHGRRPTTVLRHLPGAAAGRRGADRPAPGPAAARRRHPHRARQRPRPARRLPPPSGCSDVAPPTRRAGPTHPARCAVRRWLRHPPTPTRSSRSCGRRPRTSVDGELDVGGLRRPRRWSPSVNTPAYVLDEADFRARARAFRDALRRRTTSSTPARRSCAPRSRGGSPRRASTSTSAPAAS